MIVLSNILKQIRDKENRVTKDSIKTLNTDILKRIQKIGNKDAVRFFFDLLKELIETLNLSETDERLSLNVRNDSRKRFSVNINGRLVLGLRESSEVGLMLSNDAIKKLEGQVTYDESEDFASGSDAKLVWLTYEEAVQSMDVLQPLWLNTCQDYLPTQERSQYRKYHMEELYLLAMDSDRLSAYFKGEEVPQLNYERLKKALKLYNEAIQNTDWLTTHEGYKFLFLKWFCKLPQK
jgi:hypothetical protein